MATDFEEKGVGELSLLMALAIEEAKHDRIKSTKGFVNSARKIYDEMRRRGDNDCKMAERRYYRIAMQISRETGRWGRNYIPPVL